MNLQNAAVISGDKKCKREMKSKKHRHRGVMVCSALSGGGQPFIKKKRPFHETAKGKCGQANGKLLGDIQQQQMCILYDHYRRLVCRAF